MENQIKNKFTGRVELYQRLGELIDGFDYYYQYSDDHSVWKKSNDEEKEIRDIIRKIIVEYDEKPEDAQRLLIQGSFDHPLMTSDKNHPKYVAIQNWVYPYLENSKTAREIVRTIVKDFIQDFYYEEKHMLEKVDFFARNYDTKFISDKLK